MNSDQITQQTKKISEISENYVLDNDNIDSFEINNLSVSFVKTIIPSNKAVSAMHTLSLRYNNLNFYVRFPLLHSKYGIQPEIPFDQDFSKLERIEGVAAPVPPKQGYNVALEFSSKHQQWVQTLEDIDEHVFKFVSKNSVIPTIPLEKRERFGDVSSLFGWYFTYPNKKNPNGESEPDMTQNKRIVIKIQYSHIEKRIIPDLFGRVDQKTVLINGCCGGEENKFYNILELGKYKPYDKYINKGPIEMKTMVSFNLTCSEKKGTKKLSILKFKLTPKLEEALILPCAATKKAPSVFSNDPENIPVIYSPEKVQEVQEVPDEDGDENEAKSEENSEFDA